MKFKIEKNDAGHIKAISYGEIYVLHLVDGSERNEQLAEHLVKLLNKEISLKEFEGRINVILLGE